MHKFQPTLAFSRFRTFSNFYSNRQFTLLVLFWVYMLLSSTLFAAGKLENIHVLGTVIDSDNRDDYALIEQGKDNPIKVYIGDEIASGYFLEQVLSDKIVIKSSSGYADIKIGVPFSPADHTVSTITNAAASTVYVPGPASIVPDEAEPEDLGVILIPDPDGGGIIEPEQPNPFED